MKGASDRVELPVAAGTMSVREALSLIDGHGGAVVVARDSGPPTLLSAEDLLRALRSGDNGPIAHIQLLRTRGATPEAAPDLTISPAEGGAGLVSGGVAIVQGLAPAQAIRLTTAVSLYVCSIDDSHVFMADELFRKGRCNLDGAPVNPL